MPRPDYTQDIVSIRRQAAEGGLIFEAYLPPGLAAWVIGLVEQDVFHIPLNYVVGRVSRSLKASGREDLQIEEPITGG